MDSNIRKALVTRILPLCLLTCVSAADPIEPSNDWVFVGPETPPERIRDVASDGEGTYVAVGDNSVVYWSPNGDNWHYLPIRGLHGNIRDVLFYEGTWLFVSDWGEIGVSANGRDWDIQTFGGGSFAKIFFYEGTYYAIGSQGKATSSNGLDWIYIESPLIPGMDDLAEATVVGDKVVVVTANQNDSLTTVLTVYSSSNLIEWSESSTRVYAHSFDSIRFAAIEGMAIITYNYVDLYASRDMVNWEKVYDPTKENADLGNSGDLESAFVFNGKIVFFVRPPIHTEGGGRRPSPTGSYFSLDADAVFREEAYNYIVDTSENEGYKPVDPAFAAGDRVFIGSELGSLYSSEDFINWTKHIEGNPDDIVDIAKSGAQIAAITERGEILFSENAVEWKRIGTSAVGEAFNIDYSDGLYVIADGYLDDYFLGKGATIRSTRNRYNRLSYSNDGESWTSVHVGFEPAGVFSDPEPSVFDAYALGDEATLAISIEGKIYRSGDLENWEALETSFPDADFAAEPCPCVNKRFGMELYFSEGAFWARSVEGQAVFYSSAYLPFFSKWYRSDDLGDTWTYQGNNTPSSIATTELGQWPRPDPNRSSNEPGEYQTKTLYAFGRYIRVGEDYRIELSPTLESADHSRLVNLSLRGYTGEDSSTLIAGFVTVGSKGGDQGGVLLRGVGPSLTEVAPTLANVVAPDPRLTLYYGQDMIAQEDGVNIVNAGGVFDSVGAFQYSPDALDAALSGNFGNGLFTVHVNDEAGGVALAEIYRRPESDFELVNLSGRAFVSDGDMTCIGGFVLEGETVRTILIRGVGPGLGIGGELTDPSITLYRGDEAIASNDDWSGTHIEDFSDQAGAFTLEAGSKDAALVLPLAPGLYTVHLTAKSGDSGIALLEIYDLGD